MLRDQHKQIEELHPFQILHRYDGHRTCSRHECGIDMHRRRAEIRAVHQLRRIPRRILQLQRRSQRVELQADQTDVSWSVEQEETGGNKNEHSSDSIRLTSGTQRRAMIKQFHGTSTAVVRRNSIMAGIRQDRCLQRKNVLSQFGKLFLICSFSRRMPENE